MTGTSHTADSRSSISKRGPHAGEHTPGPWEVRHKRSIHRVGEEALSVAVAEQHHKDSEANALLIAAAPDLLLIARRTAAFFEGTNSPLGEAARAAISKATGA